MMSADAAMESRFRFIIRLIRRNCKTGDGAEGISLIFTADCEKSTDWSEKGPRDERDTLRNSGFKIARPAQMCYTTLKSNLRRRTFMKAVSGLLENLDYRIIKGEAGGQISALVYDSRK